MNTTITQAKAKAPVSANLQLGLPALSIQESGQFPSEKAIDMVRTVGAVSEVEARDYFGIMDALESATPAILYVEKGSQLDSRVLDIVANYSTGMVSLFGGELSGGMRVVKFNPQACSFRLLMTRAQVEASYSGLFEYVGTIESL